MALYRFFVFGLLSILIPILYQPAAAATFTVNVAYDDSSAVDSNWNDSVCVAQGGGCTLRAAIEQSNFLPGSHTINFSQSMTINVNSDSIVGGLPNINSSTAIDASSVWNTAGGQPGVILTRLTTTVANFSGLVINSNGCSLYGLGILGFGQSGVLVNTSNNIIGGTGTTQRCVISGNGYEGIMLNGSTIQNNTVRNCLIGLNLDGSAAYPNSNGVIITGGASLNWIGGTTAAEGNYICGNIYNGIYLVNCHDNRVGGNKIGISPSMAAQGNGMGGITICDSAHDNDIGGDGSVTYPLSANFIYFNRGYGVYYTGAGIQNTLWANVIALNEKDGVRFLNTNTTTVANNIIAVNKGFGVYLADAASNKIYIYKNKIYDNGKKAVCLASGANGGIAAPGITKYQGGKVAGTAPLSANVVQVYSDNGKDGEYYEVMVAVTNGQWSYDGPVSGPRVTALASDFTGNTSEFGYTVELGWMKELLLQ